MYASTFILKRSSLLPSGVDLQAFLPRSDSVFGDAMAAMLAPHDR
jgi:hypothetical protein